MNKDNESVASHFRKSLAKKTANNKSTKTAQTLTVNVNQSQLQKLKKKYNLLPFWCKFGIPV